MGIVALYIFTVLSSKVMYHIGPGSFTKNCHDDGWKLEPSEDADFKDKAASFFFGHNSVYIPFFNLFVAVFLSQVIVLCKYRIYDYIDLLELRKNMDELEKEIYDENPTISQALNLKKLVKKRIKELKSVDININGKPGTIYYEDRVDGSYRALRKTGSAEGLTFVEVDEYVRPTEKVETKINVLNDKPHVINNFDNQKDGKPFTRKRTR